MNKIILYQNKKVPVDLQKYFLETGKNSLLNFSKQMLSYELGDQSGILGANKTKKS